MIIDEARQVLEVEAQSILDLIPKMDSAFEMLVEHILEPDTRIVITGIGKSGLIGKKIVATLISTGTHAIFLHPVEALHGDLGMVQKRDVVIAISNSGETDELNQLLPFIRQIGCTLAGFTGNPKSTMAGLCDLVIDTGVKKEACPFNMAPTCSTTAQLAMGDALAVVLISKKQFDKSDFIKSHPGGALGQRLSFKVSQIMLPVSKVPVIQEGDSLNTALATIDRFKLGAVFIVDQAHHLIGIITDGDIRHALATHRMDLSVLNVDSIMSKDPHHLTPDSFLYDALNKMEAFEITVLPVVNNRNQLKGLIHLHDILGKGEFKFNGGLS